MAILKRGIIKEYNSGTHRAAVQVAGSIASYLTALPVSDAIPAAAVTAGTPCGVLFFTDDDPTNAVIVSVHGNGPPSTTLTKVEDADSDTKVDTEASADEDKIRMTIAGTLRYLMQSTTPHHTLTGDLQVSGTGAFSGTLNTLHLVSIGGGDTYTRKVGLHVGLGSSAAPAPGIVVGVGGYALAKTSGDTAAYGLQFIAGAGGIDLATARAVDAQILMNASGKTLTTAVGVHATAGVFALGTITTFRAFEASANNSSVTNRYGYYANDITGGTIARMMELANALVVKGSGEYTKAANQTPIFIYEGTTPTLRQLQWMDPGAGGVNFAGGERVCILV